MAFGLPREHCTCCSAELRIATQTMVSSVPFSSDYQNSTVLDLEEVQEELALGSRDK